MTSINRENAMQLANETPLNTLCRMMTYKRAAGSLSERKFIAKYIKPLPNATQDGFGNWVVRVGDSAIMYSCHTDSVHGKDGKQRLRLKADVLSLQNGQTGCLGADDAAGVWIMREMILAKKPGLYVFHREEESGGRGSTHIAENNPKLLEGVKAAIAFDRRNFTDVITHQAGGRCASDDFANSLAAQLGMGYKPSDMGMFTDTANYTDIVGECTNISVGYQNEHSTKETLNVAHALKVRDAMIAMDESKLVFARKPGEVDPDAWSYGFKDADQEPRIYRAGSMGTLVEWSKMSNLIKDNPHEVADLLEELGVTFDDLREEIYNRGGIIRSKHY